MATVWRKFGTLGRSKNKGKSDVWIRIKGQKTKAPYHCVWPPFCSTTRPEINWAILTTHEVTFPHIRLYELSTEDSITTLVSFLEQFSSIPCTMAIIVINTVESYDLDAKFSTENYRETPVPVVVVKRKTGEALLKEIKRYGEERGIEAWIEGGEKEEEEEEEEEGKAATLGRIKDKKKSKQPIIERAKEQLGGVLGGAQSRRPQSVEIERHNSMFAGPETEKLRLENNNKTSNSPENLVKNGLKVRLKSQSSSTATREFDYATVPFCSSLRTVAWTDLTTTETTYPHLRLHPLSSSSDDGEDSLSFFFSTIASMTANLALILVNSNNSYSLPGKLETLAEDQLLTFPVVMVTKETGEELSRLVEENLRGVEAMVELPPGQKDPPLSSPTSPLGSPPFRSLSPSIVKKGIRLRLASTPEKEYTFDFVSAPFSLSLRSVNWVRLSPCEAIAPHVRLHNLKEEDSLSYFMSTMASIPATLAVVLVNYRHGYELNERMMSGGTSDQECPVPMVIVTRDTGREIQELLAENDRDVEVAVDVAAMGSKSNSSSSATASSSISHTVIKRGLEVRDGERSHSFDYAWCSFNESSTRPAETLPLTLHEATFSHYRLHRLTHRDSLKFFMSMTASALATHAVILVNFDHTYRLSEKFVADGNDDGGGSPPVPVILVTNETGAELEKLLAENPRDLKAVIYSESQHSDSVTMATPTVDQEYQEVRGLHVKAGVMGIVVDYEYVPGPFRQEVTDIDWVCLTSCEATFPHIRIHDLKMEDSLSFFMSTMASTPAAMAVIFINSDNHFRLADKFKSEDQSPPVPVLVVTKETGRKLMRLVEDQPRDVYIKVDKLSLQDIVERGGLQLRVRENSPLQQKLKDVTFDFVWAPFHQAPRSVHWLPLASHETTFSHIRLHTLSDSDNLGDFLNFMNSIPATFALVIINNDNHYQLSERLASSVQTPPVPVVVVTKETGVKLSRLLEENSRELEARIETALLGPLSPVPSSTTSPTRSLLVCSPLSNASSGVISRGLEVRLKKMEEKRFFNFAWAPFCDPPSGSSLGWMGLANHQVTYEHAEIHELDPDKSLSFIFSTLGSLTSARALILINSHDGHEVDNSYRPQSEGPCLPTVVVTKRTGAELMALVRENGRDVEVRVHGEGSPEEGDGGEADDWEFIPSPEDDDIPQIPSIVESIATRSIITDGLIVKYKKKKKVTKETKFNYIWAPFCESRREIDWTPLSLSSSSSFLIPKSPPPSGYISLYDLRKDDNNRKRYNSLLQSPATKALVLINSCDGYKISSEVSLVKTRVPVVVVTKSTGDAMVSLMRDQPQARIEFGGTDEEGDRGWVVEGRMGHTPQNEAPLNWVENDIASIVREKERVVSDSEPVKVGAGEGGGDGRGEAATEKRGEKDGLEKKEGGGGGGDRGVQLDSELEQSLAEFTILEPPLPTHSQTQIQHQPLTSPSVTTTTDAATTDVMATTTTAPPPPPPPPNPVTIPSDSSSSRLIEPSAASQTSSSAQSSLPPLDDSPKIPREETPPPPPPLQTSTPSQPSVSETRTLESFGRPTLPLTGQESGASSPQGTPPLQRPILPLSSMDNSYTAAPYEQTSLPSLTPTGASSSLAISEEESYLSGTPTTLPPQEIVPYNAGPYTGPGSELEENLLSEVSITGAATIPGEAIHALKPTPSSDIDWKKPINSGLLIRPVEFQEQRTATQTFTYRWSRTTNSPQKMDWISITDQSDFPDQHIRIHRLTKNSDLQVIMAMLDESPAAALLVINMKNTYDIDRHYFPPGDQFWQVPVMVVTSETGEKIMELLRNCPASGAEARVEIESSPQVQRKSSFFKKWF